MNAAKRRQAGADRVRTAPQPAPPPPFGAGSLLALALALAACDLPTDAPILDSRWLFEVQSTTLGIEGLLPDSVSIDEGAFVVEASPVEGSEELGALCSECSTDAGRAPKPSFSSSFEERGDLPSGVASGEVSGGSVELTLVHDFGFDPIRPPGGAPGTLEITLTEEAGGRMLATLALDGAADSLPPGAAYARTIPLNAGSIGGALSLTLEVTSPAGGEDDAHWVTIDARQSVRITARPVGVRLSSVRTEILGRTADLSPAEVNVSGVDGGIVDRIQSGSFVLEVANPFGASMDAVMHITQEGDTVVSKTFQVPDSPSSSASLELTADEFRAFLGKPNVMLAGSGSVTSPSGAVMITPTMEMQIDGKIDLVLRVGS